MGVMMAELGLGDQLFDAATLAVLLTSMAAICGPIPPYMLHEGRNPPYLVTTHGAFYDIDTSPDGKKGVILHFPSKTSIQKVLKFDDEGYTDFVKSCLTIDPHVRPSAEKLLDHPFLTKEYE